MFDILFRGGTVVDGSGAAARRADVGVRDDRITAVGDLAEAAAARTFDVAGLTVAPGFIDVHNHSDGWLLKQPNFKSKTLQGFTTEVLMSDGISYAPTLPHDAPQWIHYLRALDGLQQADYRGWQTLDDYYRLLDRRTAQNVVAQIPYANLRVIASGWGARRLDDVQIKMMRRLVEQGLADGAVGTSTGLDYITQWYASTEELVEVLSAMRPARGLYVTHMRYKKGLVPALREAVEIARRAGVPLHVSHLKADNERLAAELLDYIDRGATNEVDFSFDVYPYLPGSTMIHSMLPYDVWDAGPAAAVGRLSDPDVHARLELLLESQGRNDLERIRLAWCQSKANSVFQGAALADFVASSGKPPAAALCSLLLEENLAALGVFHVGDDMLVEPFLKHPKFMLGSDGIFQPDGPVHPRQFGSAPRLLGPIVRDRRWLKLEAAVRALTSVPAERFGLVDRGRVRVGAFADLVVFDAATVTDRATFDAPRQSPIGIAHVIVNGTPIVVEGTALDQMPTWPGRWLRYNAP